jgi:lipopolysaccharide assembly outer membrane protein LptD (OstA)
VQVLKLLLLSLCFTLSAEALPQKDLMQWGSDESVLNRKTHIVTLTGNAYLFRDEEVLHADFITFNTLTNKAHAEGRIQYQYAEYYIRGDSMDIDLKTKSGTIYNGSISNGKFSLRGSRIDQVEPDHFKVKDYDYSTCYDCPNSWEIAGDHVDMTVGGYAYIQNFSFKIKDTPAIWLPYMIVPIKTKRQSGFLFPKFGKTSDYGIFFVEPYYWAINRSADMTLGVGDYANRGARFEWEGRYAISPRSQGTANFYWTRDTEVGSLYYRWAAKAALTQELPFGYEGKVNLKEVSDSGYPIRYGHDIEGRQQPVLTSELFVANNDPDLSTTVSLRRIRNLLRYDSNGNPLAGFDPLTVQELPQITASTNDHFIFGQKVATGVDLRFNRFVRAAGPFDTLSDKNGNPQQVIREANRLTLTPNVYTTFNPLPWLSVVPSFQYRTYFYNFDNVENYPNLARGYLLGQVETSFQLERMYATSDPDVSYKHTIRPSLTYSNIPNQTIISSPAHPFVEQIQNEGISGQYFDQYDIVPQRAIHDVDSYITPLGNTLTYGLTSQVFKRQVNKDGSVKADRRFEFGFNQTIDLYEAFQDPLPQSQKIVLSPLFTHFLYQNDHFYAYIEYTYYPDLSAYSDDQLLAYTNPHRFTSNLSWVFDHKVSEGLLTYDRSISLGYSFAKLNSKVSSLQAQGNFSINDYLMPKGLISYNLVSGAVPKILEIRGSMVFQNPSKCWQAEVGLFNSSDQHSGIILNLALNMSGDYQPVSQ